MEAGVRTEGADTLSVLGLTVGDDVRDPNGQAATSLISARRGATPHRVVVRFAPE